MEALARLFSALSIPLVLINMLGGVVSGIWLAILGEWGSIGYGLLFLFVGAFTIGLALLPGLVLAGPAAYFHEKGVKSGFYFFAFLSSLYTIAVITVWCCIVLWFFTGRADSSSIIPILIWSYGAATGPLSYLAQKDLQSGNPYAAISTFFAQIAFLVAVVLILVAPITLLGAFMVIGGIMLLGLVFEAKVAFGEEKLSARYGSE
jgi:hypothetical protein